MNTFEIQFRLRPIEEITPWGPELHLNHFSLTDGCYWLRCGGSELFRYTQDVLNSWHSEAIELGKQYDSFGEPYDAYQLMRLDADLSELLPNAIEPVPQAVIDSLPLVDSWSRGLPLAPLEIVRALSRQRGKKITDIDDLRDRAIGWWHARKMQVMHLRFSPRISIWRVADQIAIRWDNREHLYNNTPVWTAIQGELSLPISTFLNEVVSFRARLTHAMRERVDQIKSHWPRPDVRIDLNVLEETQRELESMQGREIFVGNTTDWSDVESAIHELRSLTVERG